MKIFATSVVCFLLFTSVACSQNLEKREAASRARAVSRSISRLVANGGAALLKSDFDRNQLSPTLSTWLERHRAAIFDAGSNPFQKQPKWGVATTRGNMLYLHILKWPDTSKLLIPRLHNSVRVIRMVGQSGELELKPNVVDWEIALPKKPKPRETILPIVEVDLDAPVSVALTVPPKVKPSEDGSIELHSRYAIVHGKMLRFEPQPHKNTVGYWVNEEDWAEWSCVVSKSCKYVVQLRYGCGDGQGGSDMEIAIGKHALPFTVEATGGFQEWRDVTLGKIDLQAGQTLKVTAKPTKKAKGAVMDIQQITLLPAE